MIKIHLQGVAARLADVAELISLSFQILFGLQLPQLQLAGLFNWFLFHRDQGRCSGCGTRLPRPRRSFFESSASAQVADVSQPLSVGCPHCKGDHQQLFENCIKFCPWLYVGHHGRLDYGRSGFLLPCLSREPNSQTYKNFAILQIEY